jgi:GDP-L-fucose synthase
MKTLITGATGMVGHAFLKNGRNFLFVGSKDCDLRNRRTTLDLLKSLEPDCVIHLAARVGGVKGNTDYVADFYSENIQINTNILDAAHASGVKKVVSLLSTCVYPDNYITAPHTHLILGMHMPKGC